MKIVLISEHFPPFTFGGGELSAYALAKYLAEDSRFDVHVVTKSVDGADSEEEMDKITVHRVIPEGSRRLPDDIRRGEILTHHTAKSLKEHLKDCDLMHTLSMRVTTGAYKAAHKMNIPIIGTVNDTWATCYYSLHLKNDEICWNCSVESLVECLEKFGGNKLALPYLLQNMKKRARVLKKFDCLLPRSEIIKQLLQKNGFKNRMEIFPPVIDAEKYHYKSPPINKRVAFIGRLDRGKGVEDAILSMKYSKLGHLIIVGDGPYRADFGKLSEIEGVKDRVEFVGKKSVEEMIDELHRSDLVLAPFRRIEPLPRILLESFACGRGIITTDTCGGSELIKNGKNGYVVNIRNLQEIGRLIDKLLSNKKMLIDLGKNGRKIFESELHPDIIIKRYKKLITEFNK
jgi:glycosyltransferase involved in cell wall biosynthesis